MRKISLLLIAAILILGATLRVYGISGHYYFTGELGKELLYTRQYYLNHSLPLVGMPTSHEWLNYGPFYYWVLMPLFSLSAGNPFILFWLAFDISLFGLVLNYLVVRKIIGERVALISTLLEAISPLMVLQTRLSKLHVFFFLIMPILMYLSFLLWNGKKKWVFWAGLAFGILFSFHFSQIPLLVLFILLFWIKRNIYKIKDLLVFAAGILIPNLTFLWQDKAIALWLPYRVVNIATKSSAETWSLIKQYLGMNLFWDNKFAIAGLVIFVFLFAHFLWTNKSKFSKDFTVFYISTSISVMMIANILHGAPPIHYFLPIFTTVLIMYSIYLSKIKLGAVILTLIFLININFYTNKIQLDDYIPYETQLNVANFIIKDAGGKAFSIRRIGPYDYFPEQYSQNYKYLLKWRGGNLVDNSNNVYTIIENPQTGDVNVQR